MNGSKDNNGQRDWKAIYARWDRERLEAELLRTCGRVRELRRENLERVRELRRKNVQLQSRVRQLEVENERHAAELRRLGITNQAFPGGSGGEGASAAVAEPEPLRQNSGRFQVSPVEVSKGVEALMLEQERREARREPVTDYQGSEGMQVARTEMARRAAGRQEEYRKMLQRDTGFC